MREFDGWHSRDGGGSSAETSRGLSHEGVQPRHEAVHDVAARRAHAAEYRHRADAEYGAYGARHARPQDAPAEHVRAETDRPASRIAGRELPEQQEAAKQRKPQRSWPTSNETSQVAVSVDALFTVVNASYHVLPGKVDGIAAAALGVVVAGVAWGNKRWKDSHGDRPEG